MEPPQRHVGASRGPDDHQQNDSQHVERPDDHRAQRKQEQGLGKSEVLAKKQEVRAQQCADQADPLEPGTHRRNRDNKVSDPQLVGLRMADDILREQVQDALRRPEGQAVERIPKVSG